MNCVCKSNGMLYLNRDCCDTVIYTQLNIIKIQSFPEVTVLVLIKFPPLSSFFHLFVFLLLNALVPFLFEANHIISYRQIFITCIQFWCLFFSRAAFDSHIFYHASWSFYTFNFLFFNQLQPSLASNPNPRRMTNLSSA